MGESNKELDRSNPEHRELLPSFKIVIVAPGFEADAHRTGLHWDTRVRLLGAALYYQEGVKKGEQRKIIVGGAQIRQMHDSFANLMEGELINKYGIPKEVIEREEYTFDTSSQVEWLNQNRDRLSGAAIITDPEQEKHFRALLDGFNLQRIGILSTEEIIHALAPKYDRFFRRLHHSPYWLKWILRERLLAALTKTIDPKGEKIRQITRSRIPTK